MSFHFLIVRCRGSYGNDIPLPSKGDLAKALSYAEIWVMRLDHAARFSVSFSATPSVNVTPSMTKGNWFAPFRRRHVLAAV